MKSGHAHIQNQISVLLSIGRTGEVGNQLNYPQEPGNT